MYRNLDDLLLLILLENLIFVTLNFRSGKADRKISARKLSVPKIKLTQIKVF